MAAIYCSVGSLSFLDSALLHSGSEVPTDVYFGGVYLAFPVTRVMTFSTFPIEKRLQRSVTFAAVKYFL